MARLGAVLDIKLADAAFNQHTQLYGQVAGGNEALRDLGSFASSSPACRRRIIGYSLVALLHGHHFPAASRGGLGRDRECCRFPDHCGLQ